MGRQRVSTAAKVTPVGIDQDEYPESELTRAIIGAAIAVHKELGAGFLEVFYEKALAHELSKRNLRVERQVAFPVTYDGLPLGEHRVGLLVEGRVVVELKCAEQVHDKHVA